MFSSFAPPQLNLHLTDTHNDLHPQHISCIQASGIAGKHFQTTNCSPIPSRQIVVLVDFLDPLLHGVLEAIF